MRVLVTGVAGFIGWKVTEFLLRDGHDVIGIDNINDAYDVRLKNWRLEQIKGSDNFEFLRGNICDMGFLKEIFQRGLNAVINLAARAGVRQSVKTPDIYYETNVQGLLNLLEMCRLNSVRKFVQASSSSVYGNIDSQPWSEDALTNRPLSPYAASKKAAEVLCHSYHYLHGIDITVFRYFTVYGPAGRPDMSPFRFVQWITEERPLALYGDGQQSRDFTYIDDIARGTILGLDREGFEVFNLGSDRPIVIADMINEIEKLVGKKAYIDYRSRHTADVNITWADIRAARKKLCWIPQTSLEDGLLHTVKWYLSNRLWVKNIETTQQTTQAEHSV